MAETSSARLARLLTLVPWLTAHSGITKQEAAAHFGLTVAQLEADLALISFTGPGSYGGDLVDITFDDATVTVFDSQGLDRPLSLSSDEAAALLLALRTLATLPDVDLDSIGSVMVKLGDSAADVTDIALNTRPSAFHDVIVAALAAGEDLQLRYHHPVRDEERERLVTPVRTFHEDGHDYLLAWSHEVEAARTFRLDRVVDVRAVPAARRAPDIERPELPGTAATVWLPARQAHLVEQLRPEQLERTADGVTCIVRVADSDWLARWALAAGADVRIVAPSTLADRLAELRESARSGYRRLLAAEG